MKKLITYFFVVLGVIFFILICAGSYVWFADPFEIRPFIKMLTSDETTADAAGADQEGVDKNAGLSQAQESALESIGINPANLPSSITPAMEVCFTEKLGVSRVAEIKGGEQPTPAEVFATRACYE